MSVVVDASFAVTCFFPEPGSDAARALLARRTASALATFDQPLAALATRLGIPLWTPA